MFGNLRVAKTHERQDADYASESNADSQVDALKAITECRHKAPRVAPSVAQPTKWTPTIVFGLPRARHESERI
jgi:hypothetical protein